MCVTLLETHVPFHAAKPTHGGIVQYVLQLRSIITCSCQRVIVLRLSLKQIGLEQSDNSI